MGNNQQNPRNDLQGSSFNPIDPAFRHPSNPENDPLNTKIPSSDSNSNKPPQKEDSGDQAPVVFNPPTDEQSPPTNTQIPSQSNALKDHDSSDIKKESAGSEIKMPSNTFLNLKEFPELEEPQPQDSETKKVLTIGGIIALALLITSVTLFVVTKHKDGENPVVEDPVTEDPVVEDPVTEDPVVEDPVTEDPVVEDPGSKDTSEHKHIVTPGDTNLEILIEKYYPDAKTGQPIELSFYDENKEPLGLIQFSQEMGIIIPKYVEKILTEKYYFFIVKVDGIENPKTALIFQSIFEDFYQTEEVLQRWESYLSTDLKQFILLGESFDFVEGADFNEFKYSDKYHGGRFMNFMHDGSVSLNYIVMRDKIIFSNNFTAFDEIILYTQTRDDL